MTVKPSGGNCAVLPQILPYAVYDMKYLTNRLRRIFCLFGSTGSIIKAP